ncbi:MAG: hypothetical protein RML94_06775 [Bacteroidia bacterium]|nr:hypothetical protein [Bacteroidia bacterium]
MNTLYNIRRQSPFCNLFLFWACPSLRSGRGIPHYASLRCFANATHCQWHAPCPSRKLYFDVLPDF